MGRGLRAGDLGCGSPSAKGRLEKNCEDYRCWPFSHDVLVAVHGERHPGRDPWVNKYRAKFS